MQKNKRNAEKIKQVIESRAACLEEQVQAREDEMRRVKDEHEEL